MSAGQEQRDHVSRRRARVDVARREETEDWPMLSVLLAGLAFALTVNTFVGLIPG